jgi:ubiquinone/menaquinone biosynthesis C-methylase UbiE
MRRPEFIARQVRCPSGWLGRVVARIMAHETSAENHVALNLLRIEPSRRVLEIGFGHGRTLARAASMAVEGGVAGVDASPTMVAMARSFNRELVQQRRMDLRIGDVPQLPFESESFDRVLSVHTIYFWPNPVEHLKEVRRVLRPGGRFVIGFRPPSEQVRSKFSPRVYTFRTPQEIGDMLWSAGFTHANEVAPSAESSGVAFAVASR